MTINGLRDLKKLIQLCQSQGIKAIEIDNIKLELGDKPKKAKVYKQIDDTVPYGTGSLEELLKVPQMDRIETDEMTEEQLLFMSSDAQSQ